MDDDRSKELAARYKRRLDSEFDPEAEYGKDNEYKKRDEVKETESLEYRQFIAENFPESFSWYEKACQYSEKIIKMKPGGEREKRLIKAIETAHLNITPEGAVSFAYLVPIILIVFFGMLSFVLLQSLFMLVFFMLSGVIIIIPLQRIPETAATKWRMKASNQMILSIFYIVTYMRHTSNLEQAVRFAADQLAPPLSIDFKKIIWNVETEKYATIKESFDAYLEQWRGTNEEFIESVHLIESSLFEGYEQRRLELLDKSLDVILEGTFEKMLHYAQDLKSPINTLNMLGVILPILGLVILPLVVSFMAGVRWYHIAAIYNIALPLGVYFMGQAILTTRPSGYGNPDVDTAKGKKEIHFLGLKFRGNPLVVSVLIAVFFISIGLLPIFIHLVNPDFDIAIKFDINEPMFIEEISYTRDPEASFMLIDFQEFEDTEDPDDELGPFGFGSSILSIFIPLGLGLAIGSYYKFRTGDVIKVREEAQKLESEFSSALFQLGNRLGDGYPAELSFGRVAGVMKDTVAGRFFNAVSSNIGKLGMSVNDAIFNPRVGAIKQYPSAIISSSMKVLVQSITKGPKIAAQAMANVGRYLKEIHKVNERLKDLMSEIIASMRNQVTFLSPAISGIVVGITAMISGILGKLGTQMSSMGAIAGGGGDLTQMFGQGIPTYYFQTIVGLYVVQLAVILTIISSGIENGEDKVGKEYLLGQMVPRSIKLYSVLALVIMTLFSVIASAILAGTAGA